MLYWENPSSYQRNDPLGSHTKVTTTISIYWRVIDGRVVKPLRSCSAEGSSRQTSRRLWPSMWTNISQSSNVDCNKSLRKQSSPQLKGGEYAPIQQLGHSVCLDNSRMTQWGRIGDSTCTLVKWWCGSLCIWDNYIQESWQHQKIQARPNVSRKAPPKNQGEMKANHQPAMHLITGDDHANQWRSTNLNQKEICPSMASDVW